MFAGFFVIFFQNLFWWSRLAKAVEFAPFRFLTGTKSSKALGDTVQ